MKLTFKQLRVFIAVAEQGSIIRVAAALHLTPPAVSMQIKDVEKNVGLALFSREKRRLSLSPAGEYFLVHAKRLLANLKEAENAMAHFKRLDRGVLTIGIASIAEYFVPRLLALFHADHPGIEVKIRVAHSREELVALMDAAEVDLSVMARLPENVAARAERFADNPYVFVCPARDPLLSNAPVPTQALDGRPLIVREAGSGTRVAMDAFIVGHRCTPQISMEIASNETIKQSVMAGIGLGFLSLHCIGLELRNGLLGVLRIADTPVMGMWYLVHLQARILSPAAEAFRHFIVDQGQKHVRPHDDMLLSLAFQGKTAIRRRTRKRSRGKSNER